MQMDVGEEELRAIELDTVWNADVADVPAGTCRADRLPHRFLGADALEHRVGADSVRQLHDARDTVVAALGDDVGRAELAGEPLPRFVPTHRDDAVAPICLADSTPRRPT